MKVMTKIIDNKKIIIGAQSGSNRVLNFIGRKHTVEDIENAVKIVNQFDLEAHIDFIFGLSGEEEEDRKETFSFIEKILTRYRAKNHEEIFNLYRHGQALPEIRA